MNKTQLLQSLKEKSFSEDIITAFSKVHRESFIPKALEEKAYEDTALPIGYSQTISQPYTIAEMLSLLELKKGQKALKNHGFLAPQKQEVFKVLEIGSGCGYVLALLSEIVGEKGEVYGIELIKELVESSKTNLKNYRNIKIYNKNGAEGLEEKSPFDRILISAAIDKIPLALVKQLKENSIIIAPINSIYGGSSLTSFQKSKDKLIIKKEIPGFIFVPFVDD